MFSRRSLINVQVRVVLKPLVSLIGNLVVCSAVDTQTDRQTERQTDRTTTVTLAAHARRGLTRPLWSPGITTPCLQNAVGHQTNSSWKVQ